MRCPKCQAEVLDWHFYCQNCNYQIQGYRPETEKLPRGSVERAGALVLKVLVTISIASGLVLMAGRGGWKEIAAGVRGDTETPLKAKTNSKATRPPREKAITGHSEDTDSAHAKPAEGQKEKTTGAAESVRALPQKI